MVNLELTSFYRRINKWLKMHLGCGVTAAETKTVSYETPETINT